MKQRIYLKVARNGSRAKVKAMIRPDYEPLFRGTKHCPNFEWLPTVLIALDIDIDDKEFDSARILLKAKIESSEPVIEIEQVEINGETDKLLIK